MAIDPRDQVYRLRRVSVELDDRGVHATARAIRAIAWRWDRKLRHGYSPSIALRRPC
jgi:hypothetical protein